MLKTQLAHPSTEERIPITENGCFSLSSDYLEDIHDFRKELFKALILDTTAEKSLKARGP
ncbi:MAG: hypothetical protein QNK11_01735 [Legionella sp.]|nr:hypothetical protein [Legionella sp.]